MEWLFEKTLLHPRLAMAVGFVLAAVAGVFLWWHFVWQGPVQVFDDMLNNNLTASSVTKVARAGGGGQSVEQHIRVQMGSTNAADWVVTARRAGIAVITESIATPATGYIRYLQIATAQRDKQGKPLNFSGATGVWGKSDGKTDASLDSLFAQSVIDVSSAPLPPIAHVPDEIRSNIIGYMHTQKIFEPSYKSAKREQVNNHDVYSYSVAVRLGAYIRMMQAFAHDLGIHSLDSIDPSQYSTLPPITLAISVDRASHQLIRISYPAAGFSQDYMDWGLQTPVRLPLHTISTTQLQQRLNAIAGGA